MNDRVHNPQPVGLWWIVFSVILGAIVIASVLPIFLIVAGLGAVSLPFLVIREQRIREQMEREGVESHERGERERALSELLCGVIDSADIPIIVSDADGLLVTSNTKAGKVLGVSHQMRGRRFDELFTQKALNELETLARGGEPGHARATIPIRGEMRDFDIAADPLPHASGAVLIFRDITELSRAVTLKADFAANASHELRTPIASIKGAAETLMGPAKDDPRMLSRLIEMISSNASRLELLARDLLDLSKLEAEDLPVDLRRVHLPPLVESVFAEFSPQAQRRDIRLVSDLDVVEFIHSDPSLIKLMLRNLVSNAIKFAHEGTSVRVIARVDQVPIDRAVSPPDGLRPADGGLVLAVKDKGVGIPLEHQQRVFERFYQVDEARSGSAAKRGTGLGLAIVKHAAKRLGGAVSLESVYQSGTTITIELPRCVLNGTDSGLDPGVEISTDVA